MSIKKCKKGVVVKNRPSVKLNTDLNVKILVVGIGGGGSSIVSELSRDVKKADFVIINTDSQSLKELSKNRKNLTSLLIGKDLTNGLGTGMDPEKGEKAALESEKEIREVLTGYDFVILVSSLGGGSGSGIIPSIIKTSKELGNVTYGIFTYPFDFEGAKRQKISNKAIAKIKDQIDSFSVVLNQKIFDFIEKETGIEDAFSLVNKKLYKSLNGLIDTISEPGLINTDWADLQAIFKQDGGLSYLNSIDLEIDRLIKIDSPEEFNKLILSNSVYSYDIENANGVLLNIFAGTDISLNHINKISNAISELVNEDAKIIIGVNDKTNKSKNLVSITLLAVGCDDEIMGEVDSCDSSCSLSQSKNYNNSSPAKSQETANNDSYWDIPTYIRNRK